MAYYSTHMQVTIRPGAGFEVAGESLHEDPIERAFIGGGEFTVDMDGIVSYEASNIFAMRALGMTIRSVSQAFGHNTSTIQHRSGEVLRSLEAPNIPAAVHTAFSLGLFHRTQRAKVDNGLSPRQSWVLEGIATGKSPKDMAAASGRSVSTINTQTVRIRERMGNMPHINSAVVMAHLSDVLTPNLLLLDEYNASLRITEAAILPRKQSKGNA